MGVLIILLLIIEVASGFLLVGIILLQRSKDPSMGLTIGAGIGESIFGARAGNTLQKITTVLAAIFFMTTVVLARLYSAHYSHGAVARGPAPRQHAKAPATHAQQAPATQGDFGNTPPPMTPATPAEGAQAPVTVPPMPAGDQGTPAAASAPTIPPLPASGK